MAKRKVKQPEVIVLPSGEKYKIGIMLVHTYHDDGTPALLKRIREDDTIHLAGGEHFITAYFPSDDKMRKPKHNVEDN